MAVEFESWKNGLWPALCEQYARLAGVAGSAANGVSTPGCGSCTTPVTSDRVYKVSTKAGPNLGEGRQLLISCNCFWMGVR